MRAKTMRTREGSESESATASASESESRHQDSESHTNPMYSHRVPLDQDSESHTNPIFSHRLPSDADASSVQQRDSVTKVSEQKKKRAAGGARFDTETESSDSEGILHNEKRTASAGGKLTVSLSEQQQKEKDAEADAARVYL